MTTRKDRTETRDPLRLAERLEDLEGVVGGVQARVAALETTVARTREEVDDRRGLEHRLAYAETLVRALRQSWRWKLGSALVEAGRRALFRRGVPSAFDHLDSLFTEVRQLKTVTRPDRSAEGASAGGRATSSVPPVGLAADVVICVHDAPADLGRCLESLRAWTNLVRHHLIVVDDGSREAETRRVLRDLVTRVPATLIRNEESRGYTAAANQGLLASSNDYVVLLNSDTVVTPGWLDKLIRCAHLHPDAGVIGPLSNAASWQSIPRSKADDGSWCVNELPRGVTPDDVALVLDRSSPLLYPSTSLVNGFCYMISRAALQRVGLLDEESFPRGYGEEDDYSLRCRAAGFRLYVADDCYVFHAKSSSFTPAGRARIVEVSKQSLAAKHPGALASSVEEMQSNEDLVRARTYASLMIARAGEPSLERDLSGFRVGWIVPHLGQVGGIRRTIEMTNHLARWGAEVGVITPDGKATDWLPMLARVMTVPQARSLSFDALVVGDVDVIDPFLALAARHKIVYHLGAYMLYRPPHRNVELFYHQTRHCVHVANSRWTAERASEYAGLEISGVFPGGVDKFLFHPCRSPKEFDVVCYGSRRPHKGTSIIEEATRGLRLLKLVEADPSQRELAPLLSSGLVLASACWHEGFNFLPLEAMACGVPVVTTDDGGTREYVVDGENALVVPPRDARALRRRIDELLKDRALRTRLVENGLRTAWRYEWARVSADFADFLTALDSRSAGAEASLA